MKNPRIGVRCRGVKIYAVPPWFYTFLFKAVSNHEGLKHPPYMAFSEGGLGETALWPPKSGFPQNTLSLKETRLHSADIGAARRGLNVLASACSGAMFPRVPPPPFTFRGSLWALRRGTLPFLACNPYLTDLFPVCQGFNAIVHNRRGKERFGLIFQRKGDILKAEVKGGLKKWQ